MSLGRRKVGIDEPSRWIFNRMADVYDARPPYPAAMIDALAALAQPPTDINRADADADADAGAGSGVPVPAGAPALGVSRGDVGALSFRGWRVADLGAGIGHLSLPLAARGLEVWAVEPARSMLDRLQTEATATGLPVIACHASSEKLPLHDASVDLMLIADALHFMDAELTAHEIRRVLKPGGTLAIITCAFGNTPFMREVARVIEGAVPRRPRELTKQMVQLAAISRVSLANAQCFDDETAVDHATLERILRSISFIGPAMNAERAAHFRARVHALTPPPVWARSFQLRWGRRPLLRAARRRELRELSDSRTVAGCEQRAPE